MKLYIIRHGETSWNTEARLQGSSDIPLNENGVKLARITGQALRHIPFSEIYSSPLSRARETAELVADHRDIPMIIDDRLQEITFGIWEGLSCHRDHYEIPSESFRDFFDAPFSYQPPEEGESINSLCDRCADFLDELCEQKGDTDQTILISTHGCTLRGLMHNIHTKSKRLSTSDRLDSDSNIKKDRSYDFWQGHVPPNCGISIVEYVDGTWSVEDEDVCFYSKEDI